MLSFKFDQSTKMLSSYPHPGENDFPVSGLLYPIMRKGLPYFCKNLLLHSLVLCQLNNVI